MGKQNYVLVTLGEHGMMLSNRTKRRITFPPRHGRFFDVSGAGDTALLFLHLGLVCGATPIEAAEIANTGSAVW